MRRNYIYIFRVEFRDSLYSRRTYFLPVFSLIVITFVFRARVSRYCSAQCKRVIRALKPPSSSSLSRSQLGPSRRSTMARRMACLLYCKTPESPKTRGGVRWTCCGGRHPVTFCRQKTKTVFLIKKICKRTNLAYDSFRSEHFPLIFMTTLQPKSEVAMHYS